MQKAENIAVVSVADMYLHYYKNDNAFKYALTDERAKVVDAREIKKLWNAGDLTVDDVWVHGKGIGLFTILGLHFARRGISFNYYDVGANIGMTTIAEAIFYQRCSLTSKVFALEPGPVHDLLTKSIAANGLSEFVTPVKAAASSRNGQVVFHITPMQSPASSMIRAAVSRPEVEKTEPVIVEAIRLDGLINAQNESGALIKIDAEGADFQVLDGLTETMASRPSAVQIEFFPSLMETYTDPLLRLTELSKRFEVWEVSGNTLQSINPTPLGFIELINRTKRRQMPATDLMLIPKNLPGLEEVLSRMIQN